jgi:hypothetical protein
VSDASDLPPPPGQPVRPQTAAPPRTDQSAAPGTVPTDGPPDGFFATAVGVVVSPSTTLATVVSRQPIGWSIGLLLVVNALTTAAQAASFSATASFGDPGVAVPTFGLSGAGAILLGVFVGAPFGLAMSAVFAAAVLLFARLLGGDGGYRVTFCGLAFATVPQVFSVIVTALMLPLGVVGSLLGGVLGLAVSIWTLVLAVIAMRHAHHLSTGRAVGAVLLPVAALALLAVLLVVVVVFAVLAAFAG